MDISVGAHLASVNGDTLQVSFRGNVHQSDVLEFFRLAEQIMAEHGLYYVIADISGLGSILPDARRESAKWGPGKQVAGTVFFGGYVTDSKSPTVASLCVGHFVQMSSIWR